MNVLFQKAHTYKFRLTRIDYAYEHGGDTWTIDAGTFKSPTGAIDKAAKLHAGRMCFWNKTRFDKLEVLADVDGREVSVWLFDFAGNHAVDKALIGLVCFVVVALALTIISGVNRGYI